MQFIIFFLLLAAPLPFASARPIWQWFWVCLIALSTLLSFSRITLKNTWPSGWALIWPVIGLGGVAFIGLLQAWGNWGMHSVNAGATVAVSIYFLAHLVWFFLVVATFSSRHKVKLLVRWLTVTASLYAAYGLIVYFTGNKTILWYDKWIYPESLTATFVNRNSYAAYCGVGLQCLLADLLYLHGPLFVSFDRLRLSWRDFISRNIVSVLWQTVSFVILLTALLLTGSRAGVFTVLVGCVILVVVGHVRSEAHENQVRRTFSIYLVLGIGALLIAGIFGLSGGLLEGRLWGHGFLDNSRFHVYPLVLKAILEGPVMGYGLGTFEEVFRQFRTEDVNVLFDRAHNDYLELAMTAGVPTTLVFLISIGAVMTILLKSVKASGVYRSYVVLGVTLSVQFALHSLIDFSLQMPAVSYSYVAILAASIAVVRKKTVLHSGPNK
ncbi:O-antigen ligase family protein [Kordiimonas marina]|uniref:O-antigen ligase family protein n=1 Tax=Kordiimonas marina TaxID=2872312 RepID=UPI001FF37CA7|nr:O-antigen ligase family protein [Kordiimonas marina]MCJ9429950.1 O-antigen ligase family protein [Kordiimonas marina]